MIRISETGYRNLSCVFIMALLHPPLASPSHARKSTQPTHLDQILSGSFRPVTTEARTIPRLALINWNIERGTRLKEILEVLRGPLRADLYLLQEVDLATRRTGCRHVAEELARGLATEYVFGVEFEELAQGCRHASAFHGQALLSRLPLVSVRVLRFQCQLYDWAPPWKPRWSWTQPRRGGRMALVAELRLGDRTVVIYNTHLESKANDGGRAQQIREVLEDMASHYPNDTSVIVAGDLNTATGAASPVVRELEAAGFRDVLENGQGPLGTKVRSSRRKDWIFVRNLRTSGASIPPIAISDHFPVAVLIALPQAAGH